MKAYLMTLNEREKWMLIGGGFFLFFYLYYLVLYSPLSSHVKQKTQLLAEKVETLNWMKKAQAQGLKPKNLQVLEKGQLLTILASKLKEEQTLHFPYHLEQTSSGDIQLSFEAVPFQYFLTWLAKLNEQYDIKTKQFDIERTKTPGVTRLMIVLSTA